MSPIETIIARIRLVNAAVGPAKLAKLSGVPYTTIREAETRGFRGKSVDVFAKLAEAAEGVALSKEQAAAARALLANDDAGDKSAAA